MSVSPLLEHPWEEESAFTAQSLMDGLRARRPVAAGPIPPLCFLDFDGDLTDWLVREGRVRPCRSWACFHSSMFEWEMEGLRCGIVARTIGGPYAVLVAEQLHASGVRLIVGLTSAGRVAASLPLPSLLAVTSAIRDEGTSLHYLPPSIDVACPTPLPPTLLDSLAATGWAARAGAVWTTDAPYRETRSQLDLWASSEVLAVEMQAASLFAFAQARQASVLVVAMISNAVDHSGPQFDTGPLEHGAAVLEAIARASATLVAPAAAPH